MCGNCINGCCNPQKAPLERKAKRATNVSYVPAAMETGRCTIVPDSYATKVLTEKGRVIGVRWRSEGGDDLEESCSIVVLAAGAIETPRLWLNSGLPNPHDIVGRYFTTHLQDLVFGIFDKPIKQDEGQVT